MIQVVSRAVEVLLALEGEPDGMSIGEISRVVKLPRSTVHRIVRTLEDELLIERVSEERGYRLGPGILRMASSGTMWLTRHVHQHLRELSARLNETVDLSLRSGSQVHFIDQVSGNHRLQAVSGVGLSLPVHCTAPGKAILAVMPDEELERVIPATLQKFTNNTVTSRKQLTHELRVIRASQVAYDREEHHLGISAVGTLIRNPLGYLMAVSIPVPSERFTQTKKKLISAMLKSREEIERSFSEVDKN